MDKKVHDNAFQFPMDETHQATMEKVNEKLSAFEGGADAAVLEQAVNPDEAKDKTVETISDDFDLTAEQAATIKQTEDIVRSLFRIMGGDYDKLIAMDDKSPYSVAARAHPAILQHVKQSENPVLEAVRIAVGFKPYQEFMEKYGDTPDAIKAAMRKELEEEMDASAKEKTAKSEPAMDVFSPVFSTAKTGSHTKASSGGDASLNDVFKS